MGRPASASLANRANLADLANLASLASLANLASLDRPADDPHLAENLEPGHSLNGCAINGATAAILTLHATAYGLELLTLVVKDHVL